jgi:hypothetical protein
MGHRFCGWTKDDGSPGLWLDERRWVIGFVVGRKTVGIGFVVGRKTVGYPVLW